MDQEYLQPDFDYNSLKVGSLRRILTENNVEFPPNARKATLKRLFEERIVPQLPELREKILNAKPSSKGIVSVENGQGGEDDDDEREEAHKERKDRRNRRKKSGSSKSRKRDRDTLDREDEEDQKQQRAKAVTKIDLISTSFNSGSDSGSATLPKDDVREKQRTRRKLANSGATASMTSPTISPDTDPSVASSPSDTLSSSSLPQSNTIVTPPGRKRRKRERTPIIDKVQSKTKSYDIRKSHTVQDFSISSTSSASSLKSENEHTYNDSSRNSFNQSPNKNGYSDIDMDSNSSSDDSRLSADNQPETSPGRHTSLTSIPAPKSSSQYQQSSTSFETYSFKSSGHLGKKIDFTYKRKPLIPELDKLSVSPEFAEQLRQTLKENDDRRRSTAESQENKGFPSQIVITTDSAATATTGRISENTITESKIDNRGREGSNAIHPTNTGHNLTEIIDVDINNSKEDDSNDIKLSANSNCARTFEVVDVDLQDSDEEYNPHQNLDNDESTDDIIPSSTESFYLDEITTTEDSEVSSSEVEESDPSTKEKKGERDTITVRPQRTLGSSLYKFIKFLSKSIVFLLTLGSLVTLLLFALWYRQQRILVGYCGYEVNSSTLSQTYPDNEFARSIDSFLEDYKPDCIPCPDHSICYPYMRMKCKPEYTLQRSKWSLFGMLPVSDTCVKDNRREQLVKEVVDKSLEFLRAKNARVSCGNGHDDIASGMSEELLYDIFQEAKATWIGDDEFDEVWRQVVEDLKNEPEIIYRQLPSSESNVPVLTNNNVSRDDILWEEGTVQQGKRRRELQYFRSVSKNYIGLRCRFEVQVLQAYERHRATVWLLILATLVGKYVEYYIRKRFREKRRIVELTSMAISKLKAQKQLGKSVPYLSSVHLRDLLLSDVPNIKYRNFLWNQVSKKVENNNTTVRSGLREVHGEMMKCWEWVGPLDPNYDDNVVGGEGVNGNSISDNRT